MDYHKKFQDWLKGAFLSEQEKDELRSLSEEEIEERFYRDLEFGTAGLRGIRGLGTNRMNVHVVRKVTQGYASFLKKAYADRIENGVYLAFDCRHFSREFAWEAARVFSGNGIPAKLFADYRSTPQLSYVIMESKAMGGLMLTASHNPPEYNGYKAYNGLGCQLSPSEADAVFDEIDNIKDYEQIQYDAEDRLVSVADATLDDAFIQTVKNLHQGPVNHNLKILYTPLHGVGGEFTRNILTDLGYQVEVVAEQFVPDGDFPTTKKPNPEEPEALKLLLAQGERTGADLLLATDPDADRLGVVVRTNSGYRVLTGNQMGALMVDYLIAHRKVDKPASIVKSVVTSDFPSDIAKKHGLGVENTLTGFKFIGDKVQQLVDKNVQVLFAFEESIGYLPGSYLRDKDGIGTSVLVAEMAGYYMNRGQNLLERLEELYLEYGYYMEDTMNIYLEGQEGKAQMEALMQDVRTNPLTYQDELEVIRTIDFMEDLEGYDKSNVLQYKLKNGSWFAVRPSGTEPKLKAYISSWNQDRGQAQKNLQTIQDGIEHRINSFLENWNS
ncbi:phospho-sugar mutase [Clostridia bacterium]|nr:phospho-sugar mutase [Clostridia bacterium]